MSGISKFNKITKIIDYGHRLASLDIGRGEPVFRAGNCGPMWAANGEPPSDEQLQKEGVVCVGLLALFVRHISGKLPFLEKEHSLFIDDNKVSLLKGVRWGLGATDEWMFLFRDKLEKIDVSKYYPRGTLLFRIWNPYDQGHVALLSDDAHEGSLLETKVIHTAGEPVGINKIIDNETVRKQHEFYKHNPSSSLPPWTIPWDKTGEFTVAFDGNYYTHILLPEYWIP